MKFSIKNIFFAIFSLAVVSCNNQEETLLPANNADERIGYVYYLDGNPLTDKDKIDYLLETAYGVMDDLEARRIDIFSSENVYDEMFPETSKEGEFVNARAPRFGPVVGAGGRYNNNPFATYMKGNVASYHSPRKVYIKSSKPSKISIDGKVNQIHAYNPTSKSVTLLFYEHSGFGGRMRSMVVPEGVRKRVNLPGLAYNRVSSHKIK